MTKIMIVMMVIVVMIIVMMVMTSVRMVAMCIVKVTVGSLIVMFVMTTTLFYFFKPGKQCSSQPYRTTYALKHQPKRGQGKWSANVTC